MKVHELRGDEAPSSMVDLARLLSADRRKPWRDAVDLHKMLVPTIVYRADWAEGPGLATFRSFQVEIVSLEGSLGI